MERMWQFPSSQSIRDELPIGYDFQVRIVTWLVSKEVNLQLEQINFYYDIAWHLMNVLSLLKMLNQRMTKSTYL